MNPQLERILPRVQKPARYVGGEVNQIIKDRGGVDTRVAFCFPDTYEIGMSNLGLRILYGVLNSMGGVWCERVFAPWGDMEAEIRRNGIKLYALESGDEILNFDVIAFSVGYEMAYTNVLNMLDLAGIPLKSAERADSWPLVIAGGVCTYNPEPLCEFIDLFVVGEGEDVLCEVVEICRNAKREQISKRGFLKLAANIPGVYVPSLYDIDYNEDGTVKGVRTLSGAPEIVTKRIVQNFDKSHFPVGAIVPSTEIIHDRVTLELFRGCVRGCRFCQAGYTYRPVRSKRRETLLNQAIESIQNSGYEEIGLSSLSTSDYRDLGDLCGDLLGWGVPRNVSLSLPSLRADNFSIDLMKKVQTVRKSGLTFAPEAGSQRLRDAINKNVTEEDLLNACRIAFEGGWSGVKLYFMLGLPTETDEDVIAIAELARKVLYTWRASAPDRSRGVRITVSPSRFVPKAHTPFQWEAQDTVEELHRKQNLLKASLRERAITYNWHDPETSFLEAVLSRGDRRLSKVLEEAWKLGAKMDAWSEYFSFSRWMEAFDKAGIDPAFYASRKRDTEEILPWSVISTGVTDKFFRNEREMAYKSQITPDCRAGCALCGADRLYAGGRCDE